MATLLTWPIHEFDHYGQPLAGGVIYGYESGTNTPKDFVDPDGADIGAVITLDADGRAIICLDAGAYKVICKDALGNQLWEVDPISVGGSSGSMVTVDAMGYTDYQHATTPASNLKALSAGAYNAVLVRGYWASGDGGSGMFFWKAGDTTIDDKGIHIQANAGGTGRWIRDYDSRLNVRFFGAAGDAVTDDASYIGYAAAYAATTEVNAVSDPKSLLFTYGQYLIGSDPGIGSLNSIMDPEAMIVWTASINPAIQPIIESNDISQHFSCSSGNAPVLSGILTIRPETFGAVGDGSHDDTDALNTTFAAVVETRYSQPGVRVELNPGADYGVSGTSGMQITNRSGLIVNGNNASITRLSDAGPMVTFAGCSNIKITKLLLKGSSLATYGIYFVKSGSTGNSTISIDDCYIDNCIDGVRLGIGDHTNYGAVKNCSFNRLQTANCTNHIHGYDDGMTGVSFIDWRAGGNAQFFVKAEYGVMDFYNPTISPTVAVDGYWVWWVQDGAVRVEGGVSQTATSILGLGMILMNAQTSVPLHTLQILHCGSSFVNHKIYTAGAYNYTGYDNGTIIAMLEGSRDLRVENIDVDVPTGAGYPPAYTIALIQGCGCFNSAHSRYAVGGGTGQPWYGGYSTGNPLVWGNFRSVGDVFYTWHLNGGGWYERVTYLQPDAINQDDQPYAMDIIIPGDPVTKEKYLRWGNVGIGNSGSYQEIGKIGYSSTATSGGGNTFSIHHNASNDVSLSINNALRAIHYGRVSLAKGANPTCTSTSVLTEGNFFRMAGTNTINAISTDGWHEGAVIHLEFINSTIIIHSDALSNGSVLLLAGQDYYANPGDTLAFVMDTDGWRQLGGGQKTLGFAGVGEYTWSSFTYTGYIKCVAGGNYYTVDSGADYSGDHSLVTCMSNLGWSVGSEIAIMVKAHSLMFISSVGGETGDQTMLLGTGTGVTLTSGQVIKFILTEPGAKVWYCTFHP